MRKTFLSFSNISFLLFSLFSVAVQAQCPDGWINVNKNLVVNGNFSAGNTRFKTSYHYSKNKLNEEGIYTIVSDPHFVHDYFISCQNHSSKIGKMMVVNGSKTADAIVWSQQIKVKPSSIYYFSIWINTVNVKRRGTSSPARLQLAINEQEVGTLMQAADTTCYWKQFHTTWIAGAQEEINLSLLNKNLEEGGNDFALDDIVLYECIIVDKK